MKITGKVTAWATSRSSSVLREISDQTNFELDSVTYTNLDMSPDWIRVGTATITLEVLDRDNITALAVDGLRAKIEEVKAKASAAVTELEGQINSLLALPMEQAPAVDPDFVPF